MLSAQNVAERAAQIATMVVTVVDPSSITAGAQIVFSY
jgi:hypothetical protein